MNLITCALLLMIPKRADVLVGQVITKFERHGNLCIETVTQVGKTWLDDEDLWVRSVPLEDCNK